MFCSIIRLETRSLNHFGPARGVNFRHCGVNPDERMGGPHLS